MRAVALGCEVQFLEQLIGANVDTSGVGELTQDQIALIRGVASVARLLLSQLPEWLRFLRDASDEPVEDEAFVTLRAVAEGVARGLRDHPEAVDPTAPASIERDLCAAEASGSQAARYGLGATISNLFSVGYGAVLDGLKEHGKTMAKMAIAAAMLTVLATVKPHAETLALALPSLFSWLPDLVAFLQRVLAT